MQAQQLWLTGPVAPRHVGSSQTRARTRVPCIGRRTLNHCATREAPQSLIFMQKITVHIQIKAKFKTHSACYKHWEVMWNRFMICIEKYILTNFVHGFFYLSAKNSFKLASNWAKIGQSQRTQSCYKYLPWVWVKPYQKIPRRVECVVLIPNSEGSEAQFWYFHNTPLMISVPKTDTIVVIKSLRLSRPNGEKQHF